MKEKSGYHAYQNIMKNPESYMNRPGHSAGRYDQVYLSWEDPSFRQGLFQFLNLSGKTSFLEKPVTVLDLGCGTGKGIELLSGTTHIQKYTGIDLSEAMIDAANVMYKGNKNYHFSVHDLNEPLSGDHLTPATDIVLSTYGTLSHLTDQSLENLIDNILQKTKGNITIAGDVLGLFSPEWPDYWETSGMNDYCMSHLNSPDIQKPGEMPRFPMRFWSADELAALFKRSAVRSNCQIPFLHFKDRSILTGRHMDTREFNPHAQPVRAIINSLLARDRRTDLNSLHLKQIVPEKLKERHPVMYDYFTEYQSAWNHRVDQILLALNPASGHHSRYHDLFSHLLELRIPDSGASLIEPTIAFLLLELEELLNKGQGSGHSLLFFAEFSQSV
jgi:SAM-dependent methyltransferase